MRALFIACLLALSVSGESGITTELICRAPDGYTVSSGFAYIAPKEFTERNLVARFRLPQPGEGELYVILTGDDETYDHLAHPRWYLGPHWQTPPRLPLHAPTAYYFQIDGNRILQILDGTHSAKWITLEGENPFVRRFGKTELQLVGHGFRSVKGWSDCTSARHNLVFYAPSLGTTEEIERACAYYDRLFQEPFLTVKLCNDLGFALRGETIIYPSLEFLERDELKAKGRATKVAIYDRDPYPSRRLKIWNDGQLIYERKWRKEPVD